MKVLFHTNTLNFRGTAVAVADYADFNQRILGNESVICYDASIPYERDMGTEPAVLENLSKFFRVIGHNGGTDVQRIIDQEKIDVAYFLRSGDKGFVANNCRTVVHAVFQLCEPHADRYAYISQWLADTMNQRFSASIPYVPHMVNLPEATANYRTELNIPATDTVIGRIGGYYTFNLPFVQRAIVDILNQRDDFTFVFVGTYPWINHPKVKFIQEFNGLQVKANFISSCDAMIHARSNGESFGLAICESLAMNKPILAWEGGDDQNHSLILQDSGLLYNENNVVEKILNVRDYINQETWTDRVAEFRPEPVMRKFESVFLS